VELSLVVFAVEGTPVDSQALILEGFAHAFAAVGRSTPPRRAVLNHLGLSLPEAATRAAKPPKPSRTAGMTAIPASLSPRQIHSAGSTQKRGKAA